MTISSAQRGDKVEGWNDCPVVASPSNSLTSSLNKLGRRNNRLLHGSHPSDSSLLQLSPSGTSSSRFPSGVPSPVPTPGPVPGPGAPPMGPPQTLILDDSEKVGNLDGATGKQEISSAVVKNLLDDVLDSRGMSAKERQFYENKIPVDTLLSAHVSFVHSVLSRLQDGEPRAGIKKDLVAFMMQNDGVSSWCSALKKLIS